MSKKILKIFIFIGLFLSFISRLFAFDANLQIDKNETDINDYISLRVEISSDEGGQIGISNIKGLENFEKIGQSQSQSSSTSMIVENGKTQSKTKTTINLDLTLKAKSKGDFVIGPAILDDGNNKIETNYVKIKVSGDNLFINNNHLSISKNTQVNNSVNNNLNSNNNINKNINNKQKNNSNYDIETYDNIEQVQFENNNALNLLLGILMIMGLGFYFILINNPKLLEKLSNNVKDIKKEVIKNDEIKEQKNKTKSNTNLEIDDLKEIDFEENIGIIYPEISDKNFIGKINEIFKQKIFNKYKINNINNKSFNEIINEIGDKNNNKLIELVKLINKAKYSNMIGDNNKILELIKNI